MKLFEVILLLLFVVYFIILFIKKEKRPSWFAWLPIAILLTTIIHFTIDGPRWQLFIVYVLTAILGLGLIRYRFRKDKEIQVESPPKILRRVLSIFRSLFGLILIGFCAFIANLFPVPTLQAPSGPFEVGTSYMHLVDHERQEMVTADTTDHRSLWIQVWYPAESTDSYDRANALPEAESYMGENFGRYGIPPFAASHLKSVKSYSYLDAPIKSGKQSYPVILYSHGLTGNLSGNTQKMQALASHGYVVFSVAHSYGTQISLNEDGSWLTTIDSNLRKPTFTRHSDSIINAKADQEEEAIFKRVGSPENLTVVDRHLLDSLSRLRFQVLNAHLSVRASDLSFVLDKAEQMQNGIIESKFQNKLDLTKVGALGASLGGPSVMLFSSRDARCLATANLDGSQFGVLYRNKLSKPHIHFDADKEWKKEPKFNDWENIGNVTPYYNVQIKGSGHGNIGDQLYSSILTRKMGMLGMGPIKPKRIYDILDSYLLAYFDKYLKDEESTLFALEKRFEEVKFVEYK